MRPRAELESGVQEVAREGSRASHRRRLEAGDRDVHVQQEL
jgi:hypothetical protein